MTRVDGMVLLTLNDLAPLPRTLQIQWAESWGSGRLLVRSALWYRREWPATVRASSEAFAMPAAQYDVLMARRRPRISRHA